MLVTQVLFAEHAHFQNVVLEDSTHFHQLPITDKERGKIFTLISNMGTLSWPKLILKKKKLDKIGKDIDHVHPLRFLSVVFSQPHLKSCMREVAGSSLKWNRFIKGLSEKLKKNAKANNLMKHVTGFAETVGADPYECYNYLIKQDWEGFVRYLINF